MNFRLFWLVCWCATALVVNAQPARIILIRHAEKPDDSENAHLSEAGREHAQKLVSWLTDGKVLGTNGLPAALYAAQPTKHQHSIRCVETLEPLAKKLHLDLHTPCPAANYQLLAKDLLRDKSLRGKTVVVCWVHEYLPELAETLGVKSPPPKWKNEDFNSAYIITFRNGVAHLKVKKQVLN